jgi:hypothetical protein
LLLLLENLPTGIAKPGHDEVEREIMKVVLRLKLLMQVAEEGFVEMDGCSAAATYQVMVCMPFYGLIAWLLAQKVIFAYKSQFTQ